MKRIKTFATPQNFNLEDWDFIQDAYRDMAAGAWTHFLGVNRAILGGGVFLPTGGGGATISAGVLLYDGELYRIPAKVIAAPALLGNDPYVAITELVLAPSGIVFPDAVARDPYVERVCDVIAAGSGAQIYTDLPYAADIISTYRKFPWVAVGSGGGAPAFVAPCVAPTDPNRQRLSYSIRTIEELELMGGFETTHSGGSTWKKVFSTSLVLAKEHYFPAYVEEGPTFRIGHMKIDQAGDVWAYADSGATWVYGLPITRIPLN